MATNCGNIDLFNDILLIVIATYLVAALLSGTTETTTAGSTPIPIVIG
ncbi:MAG: hypothetical protein N4A57_13860 [Anaeromicrobium sp.]|jgi:hypothetical protein|nr:hypothetical protein [Anaeromicrobium sp.]MCT4595331.1 hypothetical protein [Anaeromicrobium sp.]